MTPFFISLVLSALIMIISMLSVTPTKEKQSTFALKIFVISFIVIYGGFYFLVEKNDAFPEMEVGEADF